jgi:hypothetical protein
LPFLNDSFVYDFKTFDSIKDQLLPGKFHTPFGTRFFGKNAHYDETSYVDNDGYLHYLYLDEYDADNYVQYKDFDYRINSDNFRSNNFSPLDKSKLNIVTTGCSFTFGYGLPEEYVWPGIMKSHLETRIPNLEIMNLGFFGLGIDSVVNNFVSFIEKYGVPDILFALLPDMNRHVIFNPDPEIDGFMTYIPFLGHLMKKKQDPHFFGRTSNYVFEDRIYASINQIRMLEQLCRAYKIKLYWSSWPAVDIELYGNLDFKNYIAPSLEDGVSNEEMAQIPETFHKYWNSARDAGHHPGIAYQYQIANMFLKKSGMM